MSRPSNLFGRTPNAFEIGTLLVQVVWFGVVGCFSPTPTRPQKTTDASLGPGKDADLCDGFGLAPDRKSDWDGNLDIANDLPQPPRTEVETGGISGPEGGAGAGGNGGMAGLGGTDAGERDGGIESLGGDSGHGGATGLSGSLGTASVSSTGGSGMGGMSAAGADATGGTGAKAGAATGESLGAGGSVVGGSTSGGQTTIACSDAEKPCNGACIPEANCCGGCSGNKPICSKGSCTARPLGDACATSTECATGVCADGVCCNVGCDGQCETCSTSSSKGTCVPTTVPRTPCTGGASVCAGICDGTATNRKACVYPDDKTSCGASASCTGGKLTTAALCNGAGACNVSTTSPCTYGCRSDGSAACATSCPSGQGLCGGACVDILDNASHCGGACEVCKTSTPQCYSGSCVQCLTGFDCTTLGYGSESVCSPSHMCQCQPPSATNVLKNPGFEKASELTGWTLGNYGKGSSFSADDVDSCPDSGSIRIEMTPAFEFGFFKQCVPATPGTKYFFGYRYKQSQSSFYCMVRFFGGTTCSVSLPDTTANLNLSTSDAINYWAHDSANTTAPPGTGSVEVSCFSGSGTPVWLDKIYLNSVTDGY